MIYKKIVILTIVISVSSLHPACYKKGYSKPSTAIKKDKNSNLLLQGQSKPTSVDGTFNLKKRKYAALALKNTN